MEIDNNNTFNNNGHGNDFIADVMWCFFSDEMPEPYKKVRVDTTEDIIDTKTYKHNGKLMIRFTDGNEHFIGFSPKILNEKARWCYL